MKDVFISHAGLWLLLAFLWITIVMSAFEKILSWKASMEYYSNLFSKIFPTRFTRLLVLGIVLVELGIALSFLIGVYELIISNNWLWIQIGMYACGLLFLILLIGLRLIKDYTGAARLAIYIIATVVGIKLLF